MLVAFRVDASIQIGTGHIMRCLTLADELTRQGHQCWFVCREHKGHLGDLILGKGFELTMLPAGGCAEPESPFKENDTYSDWLGVSWQEDSEQTVEALLHFKADWMVVDHYALDVRWEQRVAQFVKKIMVIDDIADRNHECALLLDQNLGRNTSDYDGLVHSDCRRLIGPKFALLRPEFSHIRERSLKRRLQPELKRILISLGGVDRTNMTSQVLEALTETALPEETQLDIVMGGAAPFLEEVRQQAEQLPFKARVNVNVRDMAELMFQADLSIGAAGSTSWERCCLGLPVILVVLADNQIIGAKAQEAAGAALAITDSKRIKIFLPSALERIGEFDSLKRMSIAAAGITDGNGSTRVVDSMMDIAGISL